MPGPSKDQQIETLQKLVAFLLIPAGAWWNQPTTEETLSVMKHQPDVDEAMLAAAHEAAGYPIEVAPEDEG